MNSDDFEVASSGYGVQNDRRRPGRDSDAARNDKTNCQADVIRVPLGDRVHMPNLVPMRDYSPMTWLTSSGKGRKGPPICGLAPVRSMGLALYSGAAEGQSSLVTKARKRVARSRVTVRKRPFRSREPSSFEIPTTSAAVPVKNTSSAV